MAAAVTVLLVGCSGDDDGAREPPPTAAAGEVPHALAEVEGWETVEHDDPPPRTEPSSPELLGAIDWYAAFERTRRTEDGAVVDRVQVQGYLKGADELAELLLGQRFRAGEAGERDVLLGEPVEPTEPAIVLFPAGEGATVVASSYELSLDDLVAWCDGLRFVSDEEWSAVPSRP